jgi:hypothetical protein
MVRFCYYANALRVAKLQSSQRKEKLMGDDRYEALAARVDALARVLMQLIADMEIRENLNGDRLCRDLRQLAESRQRHPELEASALLIKSIADELDSARANRKALHPK